MHGVQINNISFKNNYSLFIKFTDYRIMFVVHVPMRLGMSCWLWRCTKCSLFNRLLNPLRTSWRLYIRVYTYVNIWNWPKTKQNVYLLMNSNPLHQYWNKHGQAYLWMYSLRNLTICLNKLLNKYAIIIMHGLH